MPEWFVQSAWLGHAPFAFWLIDSARPKSVVELGAHTGFSYFAFCQAVDRLSYGARCFAVDTWEGDEHAGFYGAEVFESVSRHNAERYGGFSRLVRSTFHEAAKHFDDGSVDLLHVDGRHFYRDVRMDFETWLPKLSERAVVLLHDTNVRERDFGVHRLWSEATQRFSGFEFVHSHGLGVLSVGSDVAPAVKSLVGGDWSTQGVRAVYSRLGAAIESEFDRRALKSSREQLVAQIEEAKEGHAAELEKQSSSHRQAMRVQSAELEKLQLSQVSLTAALEDLRQELDQAIEALEDAQQRESEIRTESESLRARVEEIEVAEREAHELLRATEQRLKDSAEREGQVRRKLRAIETSTSWRATAPVRAIAERSPRLQRGIRSVGRAIYWILTGRRREVYAAISARVTVHRHPDVSAAVPSHSLMHPRIHSTPTFQSWYGSLSPLDSIRARREWLVRLRAAEPITIIVPIYDAVDALERCLASIERNTTVTAQLLLLDDASTDPGVRRLLDRWEGRDGVSVLRNEANLGFTRTVNRGFAETSGDVIILNSDTEVPPFWLQRLQRAAASGHDVGTVTPLSDNSGAFAAPELGVANPVRPDWGNSGMGRVLSQAAGHAYPQAPTGNGFCMYIRREVLDAVGPFDAEAFPRGYGEENDFCMRARVAGWQSIVDDASFVAHQREASFGGEKKDLVAKGRAVVDQRWPEYTSLVRTFVNDSAMVEARAQVGRLQARTEILPRPCILYILHMGGGGTPATTRDLAHALAERWNVLIFSTDGRSAQLEQATPTGPAMLESHTWVEHLRFGVPSEEYDAYLADVIDRYGVELVHVRHMVKQPLSAPSVARALGVPVVASFHDFYMVCPTFHLLDERGVFCGGQCTPGPGDCHVPMDWVREELPPLKHQFVHTWKREVESALEGVDAFVTTVASARETVLNGLPGLADRRFEVIEHGRDVERRDLSAIPSADVPLRVLVPGNIDRHKGAEIIREVAGILPRSECEFHFLGTTSDSLQDVGVHHGRYERSEFDEYVRMIRPHYALILSTWAETYCHTLTESWAAGLPVVGSSIGAIGERIRREGGGIVVESMDSSDLARILAGLREDPERHRRLRAEVRSIDIPTTEHMASQYEDLYSDVVHKRRTFASSERPRVALIVPGGDDPARWNGTTHIRIDRRYANSSIREVARTRVMSDPSELEVYRPDLTVVLRDALGDLSQARFVAHWAAESGCRLVHDIDDALTEHELLAPGSPYRGKSLPMQELASMADLVTVSTPRLAELMRQYNDAVAIVPNALDERLWFSPMSSESPEAPESLRVLYFGTATHRQDLALLQEAWPMVERLAGVKVHLEVVGVQDSREDGAWFRRLHVPSGSRTYPKFVRWLRMNRHRWVAGVAPLADNRFNHFKSDLKYLEYSALGLPVIASQGPAYGDTIVHGSTGLLCGPDPLDWASSVASLVKDEALRESFVERSREYVLRYRTCTAAERDIAEVIEGL
jgi:O-antigen biosynthesis protein